MIAGVAALAVGGAMARDVDWTLLVGREAERARIDRLLSAARAGRSGATMLRGEAGIGKSALLDYAVGCAGGMRVLAARGTQAESELPYAGLFDLVRPVLDRISAIPAAQAAALQGALALAPAQPGERFAVSVATLSLLAAAAEEIPVLGVVDDFQWLDGASAEALLFATRRLDAEGIVLLFAARIDESRAAATVIPELLLEGLDRVACERLLAAVAPDVAGPVAAALHSKTAGNPLALIEIPALLSPAQRAGSEPLEDPLPVGPTLERAFRRRIEALPAAARRALLVAAASESGEMNVIVPAIRLRGVDPVALEPGEIAALVEVRGARLEFRHPLLRSAVYRCASPAERRAAHRALAAALSGEQSADRRAWHLAAAAIGPDEAVAQVLEETGERARARTGYPAAMRAFVRAAELSVEVGPRTRRLAAAAVAAQQSGQPDRALGLLDQALAATPDPLLRFDLEHLRGQLLTWSGRPGDAHELLVAQAARLEHRHPAEGALALVDVAFAASVVGDIPTAVATARRAKALAQSGPQQLEPLADTTLLNVLVLGGDSAEARALLERVQPFLDRIQVLSPAVQVLPPALNALLLMEEYAAARALVERTVNEARAAGALSPLPNLLSLGAWLEFLTGNWAAAYAHASEAGRLGDETRQPIAGAYALISLAQIEAAQGREQDCREHAAQGRGRAESAGVDSIALLALTALGLLELGLGRPTEALARLEAVDRLAATRGLREVSGPIQWTPDLTEAYIRAGRRDDARRLLARVESELDTGRTALLAAAARARGLLADDDGFEAEFARARAWHDRTPTPFERARTDLCLGERLRRAKRREESRVPLRAALEVFERLGARPWADRTRLELEASGLTARQRDPATAGRLTAQELQVALRIAAGATNRQAAAELFLSPKTIEYHLANVYRKLDVHSRARLARLVAQREHDLSMPVSSVE